MFRIFDPASWLFLLISIISVSVTCVILASISHSYGVITIDTTMMILLPFQMLLGEQLESGEWFVKKVAKSYVKIFLTISGSGYQERLARRKRFRRI